MKLKPHILTTTIALLASAAFAAEPTTKSESTATVTTSGKSGKATITIDVNGKKETREIDLGSGTEIKVTTNSEGGGSVAVGAAGGSAGVAKSKPVTWLGVALAPISEELSAQLPIEPGTGVTVGTVMPESPAEKAGLQKNDVLTKIDDVVVTDFNQVRQLVAAKKDGDIVKVTYFRRGQQATMDVKLATHLEENDLNWLPKLPMVGTLFEKQSKPLILDKHGNAIGANADQDVVERITKMLRDAQVDEKWIGQATRSLNETTATIRDALKDAGVAQQEVQKRTPEMVKALEDFLATLDKVRKEAEQAVAKERERRQVEKP